MDHPSSFENNIWYAAGGHGMMWKNMETSHLMNCVKMLERMYKDKAYSNCGEPTVRARYYLKIARDMNRYVVWREKAHA